MLFKKTKKTRCRPEAPLERLIPLKIEVDIKKIISTVKAVKLGFLKLLNLHEDVRSSNQPRLCFVYHLHYYNISRATSWLEGGGHLKCDILIECTYELLHLSHRPGNDTAEDYSDHFQAISESICSSLL